MCFKKNQNKLEEILTGPNFQWVYTPETVKNKPKSLRHFEDISILGHNFIVDGKLNSNFFEPITSLMGMSDLITKLSLPNQIIRSQINLFLKRDRVIEPCPHIDFKQVRHLVLLYYVNDCDGDTIFYNLSDCDDHRLDELEVCGGESLQRKEIL